jgi:hypothetical protein
MERLASHTLDNTPGHADCGALLRPSELRGLFGPSLVGSNSPSHDGLSLCPAARRAITTKNILRKGEYCAAAMGNSIPGYTGPIPGEDAPRQFSRVTLQNKQPLECCFRDVQLNKMAGFPEYPCALSLRNLSGNRALPQGHRASHQYHLAGLGSAPRILNDKAVSVFLPFFTLGCRD